jgi:nicotinamide riboside transporter PnuC
MWWFTLYMGLGVLGLYGWYRWHEHMRRKLEAQRRAEAEREEMELRQREASERFMQRTRRSD